MPSSSRESLSRSYDSPEGIRRLSQGSARKASLLPHRAGSPPLSNSFSRTNQTILDDAAWLSEKIHNLQKAGFVRYPAVSKLHGHVLCESVPNNRELQQSPTGIDHVEEPLSAFKLSEVVLSEEDVLTDMSTCTSIPVAAQPCLNFDNMGTFSLYGSCMSPQHDAESSNISIIDNVKHISSATSKEGDLLSRLEALQYRAEVAAKSERETWFDKSSPICDKQFSRSHWIGQLDRPRQGELFHQATAALASGRGTLDYSDLSMESVSWPEKSENSNDSTCWLKAVNKEEGHTEPFINHLIYSSSKQIRPEYYLPLSKEEVEPVHAGGHDGFSCLSGAERHGNSRRLPAGRSPLPAQSPLCKQKYFTSGLQSEGMFYSGTVKPVGNKRQISPSPKSRRISERSSDTAKRFISNRPVSSLELASSPSARPSPAPASTVLRSSARTSCHSSPVGSKVFSRQHHTHEQNSSESRHSDIVRSRSEMDGQNNGDDLDYELVEDGESSWISAENVERFLSSHSLTAGTVASSSPTDEVSNSILSRNLTRRSGKIVSSCHNDGTCRDKSFEISKHREGRVYPSSQYANVTPLNVAVVNSKIGSLKTHPKQSVYKKDFISAVRTDANITSSGSDGNSSLLLKEASDDLLNWQHSQLNDESLSHDKVIDDGGVLSSEHSKGFHKDHGAKKHTSQEMPPGSYGDAPAEDIKRMVGAVAENKVTLEAEFAPVWNGKKPVGWLLHGDEYTFSSPTSIFVDVLSPADKLVEDQQRSPVIVSDNTSKVCSQDSVGKLSPEYKMFTRIIRSLSFNERDKSGLHTSSTVKGTNELYDSISPKHVSESKSTRFRHYWMPVNQNLKNIGEEFTERVLEEEGSEKQLAELNSRQTQDSVPLCASNRIEVHGMDKKQPRGNEDRPVLLENCASDSSATSTCVILEADPNGVDSKVMLLPASELETESGTISRKASDNDLMVPDTVHIESDRNICQQDMDSLEKSKNRDLRPETKRLNGKPLDTSECSGPPEREQFVEPSEAKEEGETDTKTVSSTYTNVPAVAQFERALGLLNATAQHESLGMLDGNGNKLVVQKGMKADKLPCPFKSKDCEKDDTRSSLLSVYKNPLWLDDSHADSEQFCQSQSERTTANFGLEEKNIGFSNRSIGDVWDTYDGMGQLIIPTCDSPSCTHDRTCESDHTSLHFDELIDLGHENGSSFSPGWDVESNTIKSLEKIGDEVQEGSVALCESCLVFEDTVITEVIRSSANDKLGNGLSIRADQHPNRLQTRYKNIIGGNIKEHHVPCITSMHSLSDGARLEAISECDEHGTGEVKDLSSIATACNDPEVNSESLLEKSICSGGPCPAKSLHLSHCLNIEAEENIVHGNVPAAEGRLDPCQKLETVCGFDAAKLAREGPHAKFSHSGIEFTKDGPLQHISDALINIQKKPDQNNVDTESQKFYVSGQNGEECPHKDSGGESAAEENQLKENSSLRLNGGTEAREEVKQVAFIFPDSKRAQTEESQKEEQSSMTTLTEVPPDVLSTWVLSFFSHATMGGKKKEQKELLIPDRTHKNQADLNKIGQKVEALEAEIHRFKEENKKLQNLIKCMIGKMKQLQHGLRGRKRHGSSRGFMTCIYLVRVRKRRLCLGGQVDNF